METSLRKSMEKVLNAEELEHFKTSFDVVGDIAIMEIDDELISKEKEIGEMLLKLHKSVKVVCKKSGIHNGVFRTQDLLVIAGEDRKETVYKENGIQLKLDVEKVYFSPRLSTDRKRISEMLQPGEDVLAMFSGCGPYPMVMLRKEPTINVVSIEINPNGAKYQRENLILNKSIAKKIVPSFRKDNKKYLVSEMRRKVRVVHGDVNDIVPELSTGRIGIKSSCSITEIDEVLKVNPDFIELYLDDVIEKEVEKVQEVINYLYEKDVDVMLHACSDKFNEESVNLFGDENEISGTLMMLSKLEELFLLNTNVLGAVVHPIADGKVKGVKFDNFLKNVEKIKLTHPRMFESLYFENMKYDFYSESQIMDAVKLGGKICFDINHYYEVYKDTPRMATFLEKLCLEQEVYFHISDSNGQTEKKSVPLGKGKVDYEKIVEFIKFGCVTVGCEDYSKPVERVESYQVINSLLGQKKFDRILMPLPKSAEDFLDTALLAAKKGTVIHFYDFLNDAEFDLAKKKIDKADGLKK